MTEGKSDLGFFLVPKLASQSPDLRKKSQKNPDIKGKSKRHVTLHSFYLGATSIIIITIVIIINNLLYFDLEMTTIM